MECQFTVFYIRQHHGIFIHHADTHVQGTGHPVCTGSNGQTRIHIHIVDGIFMAGFYFGVLRIIYRRIGHHSDRRAMHLVGIDIVSGLKSSHSAARHGAGHVKGRHGLLRIRSHVEVFGIDVVFCLFGCSNILLTLLQFGRHACRCHTVNLIGSTGKARRAGQFLSDSHRCRAAEFRHVCIIRCMDIHIAATVSVIKIGIQHLRYRGTAHIIQIHYACQ